MAYASVRETLGRVTPGRDTRVRDTHVSDSPVSDTPVSDTPSRDTRVSDSLISYISVNDALAGFVSGFIESFGLVVVPRANIFDDDISTVGVPFVEFC